MIELPALLVRLRQARLPLGAETQTQAALETYLRDTLYADDVIEREVRFNATDRPDFLINKAIIIELKANRAAGTSTLRQLDRYAQLPGITDIILLTNRAMTLPKRLTVRAVVPEDDHCVLLHQVSLGRAWM